MPIELTTPELTELHPRITVMGVGGAGGNAVNNMIRSELPGVSFVVANTDAQSLAASDAEAKIQLGVQITQGLGAGAKPDVGQRAAEEAYEQIEQHLDGCHMLFLTAGMGGGTGTGATPVIAQLARERGILTVGVVTKPFQFEGGRRMKLAEAGIAELQKHVDTLIIIPNQNLFRIATEKTTFADAFAMADEVLNSGVRGITDLMVMPGLINLDFADVKTVMSEMGKAMMGTGEADGERRAIEAAEAAISNPLLDEVAIKGAKGVIINITGGMDLTLFEVDEAANHIRNQVDADANIIVGSAFNESLNGQMRVSVVATGIAGEHAAHAPEPAQSASVVSFAPLPRPQPAEAAAQRAEEPVAEEAPIAERADQDPASEPAVAQAVAPKGLEHTDIESIAAADEDVFFAPEPQVPGQAMAPAGRPDPFAEAAFANGARPSERAAADDAEAARPRGRSLFARMTNLGGKAAEAAGPAATADEAAPAEHKRLGRMSPEDRPVPNGRRGDEQLEIPAFLRRQAN